MFYLTKIKNKKSGSNKYLNDRKIKIFWVEWFWSINNTTLNIFSHFIIWYTMFTFHYITHKLDIHNVK